MLEGRLIVKHNEIEIDPASIGSFVQTVRLLDSLQVSDQLENLLGELKKVMPRAQFEQVLDHLLLTIMVLAKD